MDGDNGVTTRIPLEEALRVVEEDRRAQADAARAKIVEFREQLAALCAAFGVTIAVSAPAVVIVPVSALDSGDLS